MIKSIEKSSVHRITSGQVVVDLQSAVKELVENSLDAGATTVEVRFKDHGLQSFEVVDNGSGISPRDYDSIALKHYTSKLETFDDLTTVQTFGFRGEALSSLCALSKSVKITTATSSETPMGTILELDRIGNVTSCSGKIARQRGTTVVVEGLFTPLPVRRKELERNAKREFGKALNLLTAYALVPCSKDNQSVRLNVSHQPNGGRKTTQMQTNGSPSLKASISSLWGPKQLENLLELELRLEVTPEKNIIRRQGASEGPPPTIVQVRGFISKFSPGHGRTGTDRQFFFINGRPCNPAKVQKAFNEVYRSFNTNQSPFVVADFVLPTDSCDINVSPDKRTILLHSENNLITALKASLEETFAPSRSTYAVQSTQSQRLVPSQRALESVQRTDTTTVDVDPTGDDDVDWKATQTLLFEPPTQRKKHPYTGDDTAEKTSSDIDTTAMSAVSSSVSDSLARDPAKSRKVQSNPSDDDMILDVEDYGQVAIIANLNAEPHSMRLSTSDSVDSSSLARPPVASSSRTSVQSTSGISRPLGSPTMTELLGSRMRRASSAIPAFTESPDQNVDIVRPFSRRSSSPSSNRSAHTSSVGERGKSRSVQMVLSTTNASWNLHQQLSQSEEPPKKKAKPESSINGRSETGSSRLRLRTHLSGFAKSGSRISQNIDEDGHDSAEEEAEQQPHANDIRKDAKEGPAVEPSSDDVTSKISSVLDATPDEGSDLSSTTVSHNLLAGKSSETAAASNVSDLCFETGNEILHTVADDDGDVSYHFNIARLESTWTQRSIARNQPSGFSTSGATFPTAANIANVEDEESAERELSRVIHKEDFGVMEVVGQFNLGFIIARRRVGEALTEGDETANLVARAIPVMDDLFIIDQHAADEKYNFETLQQTTKIQSQKLYRPLPLELTAADELVAVENVDVLRKNGFDISVDENVDSEGRSGKIKLVAQPVSGSTTFNMKDLEELLHLMRDQPAGRMVRCSKARAMFAMRACRKSIMIGHALTTGKMASVVRHMGTLQQPWNCPHGRPTMRHLVSLSDTDGAFKTGQPTNRTMNWSNL